MKRLIALAAAAAFLSCGGGVNSAGDREYTRNDLQLITAFTAKSMCSCLFVMEMDEDYCKVWAKQNPPVADYRVDKDKKTVQSGALMFWLGKAHYVDAKQGCVLDP